MKKIILNLQEYQCHGSTLLKIYVAFHILYTDTVICYYYFYIFNLSLVKKIIYILLYLNQFSAFEGIFYYFVYVKTLSKFM